MNRLILFQVCLACLQIPLSLHADERDSSPRLGVHGKDLLYDGKPIRLRGVAVGDPWMGRKDRPESDFEFLAKDWKANVVRIGIHPGVWKKEPHDKVLDRLAEDVDAALKNGMFVIIDWHAIGWPDGYYQTSGGGAKDIYDSDFKLAKDFWAAVAKRYGKNGRVMFELWNEPAFQKDDWGAGVGQKWASFKPYMKELIGIIREHGDNVVIVSSNRWSYWLKGVRKDLLEGKNIAYAWHVYAGHSKNDPKAWAEALDDLQIVAPVLVTEWGFQPGVKAHYKGTAEDFGKLFVKDFLEAKGLHSTAWCWHPYWGPPMLKEDWRTPNEFGSFVRSYLRQDSDPDALRQAAMNNGGDPKRGKALYLSTSTKCATCHKVHGEGGDMGPDLSQIGGKFDRTHLIESVLDPSAEILLGYHATIIETKSGRVFTGIVKSESATEIKLVDAEAKPITIPVADIESRKVSKVSIMPQDLALHMNPAEFTDLIAYLETLRTGPVPTPGQGTVGPLTLPPGFKAEVVATGLSGATAMEVTSDGRIFICEQTGTLRVIKDGKVLPEPFVKLPVDATWERGLIGVTVAPDFPKTPHIYLCYVAAKPYPHHVVSRFTAKGDVVEPGSEKILLEGDDQTKLGGTVPAGHQGGAIHFGKDGKLYIAIGDQTAGKPAQDLNSLLGKLLRINSVILRFKTSH